MSWLTPKNVDDAARVLRGIALVLARAAADSPVVRRANAGEYQRAMQAAADLMQAHADRARMSVQDAAATGGPAGAQQLAGALQQQLAQAGEQLQAAMGPLGPPPAGTPFGGTYIGGPTTSSGMASAQGPGSSNPLIGYIFPDTARMMAAQQAQQQQWPWQEPAFGPSDAVQQMAQSFGATAPSAFVQQAGQALSSIGQSAAQALAAAGRGAAQVLPHQQAAMVEQQADYFAAQIDRASDAVVQGAASGEVGQALGSFRAATEQGSSKAESAVSGAKPGDAPLQAAQGAYLHFDVQAEPAPDQAGAPAHVESVAYVQFDTVPEARPEAGLRSAPASAEGAAAVAARETAAAAEFAVFRSAKGDEEGVTAVGASRILGSDSTEADAAVATASAGPGQQEEYQRLLRQQRCQQEQQQQWQQQQQQQERQAAQPATLAVVGVEASAPLTVPVTAAHDTQQQQSADVQQQKLAEAAAAQQQQQQQQQQQRRPVVARLPVQDRPPEVKRQLRERSVPSTQFGRAMGFAGMGASLVFGSLRDSVANAFSPAATTSSGSSGSGGNSYITQQNAERLANALCRMRGAALKIGQMLSIQDETILPPQIQAALERVRDGADVMPRRQLEQQLRSQLGPDWQSLVAHFDWEPKAAASIGQVHQAVLHDGRTVAMKVQYPGVARSIKSDVDNLMRLISISNILPRGMYLENAAKVAKRELALECDYTYEAAAQQRYKALIAADPELSACFNVPTVVPELSRSQVLTSEWVSGVSVDKVQHMPQEVRDDVGKRLLQLTLKELFDWRYMQTDPNWGNFMYDAATGMLHLIDFGAAKGFQKTFVDDYMRMVKACAERDSAGVIEKSTRLGFLTGDESKVMLDAHCEAGFVVGMPFAQPGIYDFGRHSGMTARVSELGSIMLKHRLTAPPEESYSLHRKLSGAFLACMKLRAQVPCHDIFYSSFERHNFGPEDAAHDAADSTPPLEAQAAAATG